MCPAISSMELKKIYGDYLELKHIDLEMHLKELYMDPLFGEIVPVAIERGYRNRAKFQVNRIDEIILVTGTDPLLGRVCWEETDSILPEWGGRVLKDLISLIETQPHFSPIDGFELQFAHGREEAHLILSIKRRESGDLKQIALGVLQNIPAIKGAAIPSQKISVGQEELRHRILEQDFYSHYQAFFQSNLQHTPLLMLEVKQGLGTQTFSRIIDLFCGTGLFSLYLRDSADSTLGVDIERHAVESARKNAERMRVGNTKYTCGSVQKWVEKYKLKTYDLVIIDPPRSGCPMSVIQAVGEQSPRLICLISCYPDTFFRDLKIWRTLGWKPVLFKAFDMFPFTKFLETVTFLRKEEDIQNFL